MDRREKILQQLRECYPDAKPQLQYSSAFELLVAVILSAQCTDVRVNKVTKVLFAEYNTPRSISAMPLELLESYIKPCGLYKNKAKNIQEASRAILTKFNGQVPSTREELMSLPGVGRKTANVVLSVWFGVPALAVDTHVFRVSNRTQLAPGKTPEEVEEGLMKVIPWEDWASAHHWLIFHGRRVCHARSPECGICTLREYCPEFGKQALKDKIQEK